MDVYVQHVGSGAPLRLTMNPATDNSARWSPDGRWIAFLRLVPGGMQELRLVPPLGGPERKLTDVTPRDALRPISAAWCPDATCLVVTDAVAPGRADALYLVSVESGARRQLTFPPDGVLSDNDPAISPDGAWLAFRRDNAPFAGSITLVRLVDGATSGEPRALTEPGMLAFTPVRPGSGSRRSGRWQSTAVPRCR
jgi:Tol biopolymer transport system component